MAKPITPDQMIRLGESYIDDPGERWKWRKSMRGLFGDTDEDAMDAALRACETGGRRKLRPLLRPRANAKPPNNVVYFPGPGARGKR